MVAFMLGLNNWSWSQNSKMFLTTRCFFPDYKGFHKCWTGLRIYPAHIQTRDKLGLFTTGVPQACTVSDGPMDSHKSGRKEIYGSRFLSPSQCMRPHLFPVHGQELRNTLLENMRKTETNLRKTLKKKWLGNGDSWNQIFINIWRNGPSTNSDTTCFLSSEIKLDAKHIQFSMLKRFSNW